jgi:YbgC/YbaW family acyl-CoA thioester hydrolase
MIFHQQIRIEFADTDAAGICHFANYLRFMERVEHAFFRSLGLSVVTPDDERSISFPRVKVECDYRAPAHFEEVIDVELTVERVGGKSLTFALHFHRDGKPIARGRMVCVCCHMVYGGAMTPIDIPDFSRTPLAPYARTAGDAV